MNNVCLIGRLTKDVEVRYTQTNNTMVVSFTLAVNRKFAKKDEQQADFINIIAWNKTAEFCSKYFKKGMQVSVVGRIQTRSWDDQNGQKRYATEVIAEELGFADSKREADSGFNSNITETFGSIADTTSIPSTNEFSPNTDDDLPF